MFTFHVDVDEKVVEFRQARLNITSPQFNASFIPDSNLPQYETIDVMSKRCELIFNQSNGIVSLKWDEKKVAIELSSFDEDKGLLSIEIPKTDDSLQQALKNWIEYQKEEAIISLKMDEINENTYEKLEAIHKPNHSKQKLEIETNAENEKDELQQNRFEAITKKQKTK
jgi:hypothetical protein